MYNLSFFLFFSFFLVPNVTTMKIINFTMDLFLYPSSIRGIYCITYESNEPLCCGSSYSEPFEYSIPADAQVATASSEGTLYLPTDTENSRYTTLEPF